MLPTNGGLPVVATFVEPGLRGRLDTASRGFFYSVHASSMNEVARAVKERPVSTLLVSPYFVKAHQLSGVEHLVRAFPALSTVAVVDSANNLTAERLLDLGASGVKKFVDLRDRSGWGKLREIIAAPANASASRIINSVIPALGQATGSFKTFFEAMVRLAPELRTIRSLCRHIGVHPTTVMSRFLRAGLPSPRTYLSWIRLLHAAEMAEDPGLSLSDIAYRLDHSSPQSFGRHIKNLMGCTAGEFRIRHDFESAMELFLKRIVVPYRAITATFDPLPTGVRLGQRGRPARRNYGRSSPRSSRVTMARHG